MIAFFVGSPDVSISIVDRLKKVGKAGRAFDGPGPRKGWSQKVELTPPRECCIGNLVIGHKEGNARNPLKCLVFCRIVMPVHRTDLKTTPGCPVRDDTTD